MGQVKLVLMMCVLMVCVVGCGADKSREDSGDITTVCKTETQLDCVDKSPKKVIANHNGFPNITTGCDGYGYRYWITTRERQDFIVIKDFTCGRKGQ